MSQPKAITYSESLKVPGAVQYSSHTFHLSVEMDVEVGEAPEQAVARAKAFVQRELSSCRPGPGRQPTAGAPRGAGERHQLERFDFENAEHCAIADRCLRAHGIRTSRWSYIKERILPGVALDELGPFIKREDEEFQRRRRTDGRGRGGVREYNG